MCIQKFVLTDTLICLLISGKYIPGMTVTANGDLVLACHGKGCVLILDKSGKRKATLQGGELGLPWDATSTKFMDDAGAIFIADNGK